MRELRVCNKCETPRYESNIFSQIILYDLKYASLAQIGIAFLSSGQCFNSCFGYRKYAPKSIQPLCCFLFMDGVSIIVKL